MERRCLAIFQDLDTDGSGGLDEDELVRGFSALGIKCEDPAALLAQVQDPTDIIPRLNLNQ